MRNFLAFVGLVVVGFAGAGYYFGWYQFALSPGKDGKQHISVDVDTKKIGQDVETGVDKGGQLVKDKLKKEDTTPEPKPEKSFFDFPAKTTPTTR